MAVAIDRGPEQTVSSYRWRSRALLLWPGLAGFAVAFAVLTGAVGLVAGLVAGVVAGVLLAASARACALPAILSGVAAQPCTARQQPRLHNLVEGLCAASGLAKPELRVVDSEAVNCLSAGRSARHASLVVTRGMLESLSRVELEGVLAHELSHIRAGDVVPATVAVSTVAPVARLLPPLGRRLTAQAERREVAADLAAVALTRYPPGLIGALAKMTEGQGGPRAAGVRPVLAEHLWIVPTRAGGGALQERIEALQEI